MPCYWYCLLVLKIVVIIADYQKSMSQRLRLRISKILFHYEFQCLQFIFVKIILAYKDVLLSHLFNNTRRDFLGLGKSLNDTVLSGMSEFPTYLLLVLPQHLLRKSTTPPAHRPKRYALCVSGTVVLLVSWSSLSIVLYPLIFILSTLP